MSAAIQERLEAVEARGGVQGKLHVEGEERLPLDIQKELYFIAQEGFKNAPRRPRRRGAR